MIAGCGGWSRRKKLYGGDAWTEQRFELLEPAVDAAKIRAFFIAPEFARLGVGTRILQACETAAFAEGFRRFEMGATLTGVKLFGARGYVEMERIALDIGGGESLPVVRMEKRVCGLTSDALHGGFQRRGHRGPEKREWELHTRLAFLQAFLRLSESAGADQSR